MAQLNGSMFPPNQPQPNSTDKPPNFNIPMLPQIQNAYSSYQQQPMNYPHQQIIYHQQTPMSALQLPQQNGQAMYMTNHYQQPPQMYMQNRAPQYNQQNPPQVMQMNAYQASLHNNPIFIEYLKQMNSNQMIPQSISQINFKPRKTAQPRPPPGPNDPPKKRGRPKKTEEIMPIPKPVKKKPNENSDDFESFADDYIPKDLMACRTVVRKNRRTINYNEEMNAGDFDEEEEEKEKKSKRTRKIEHIYASRKRNETEYLIKFQDSTSSALCQWILESQMRSYSNAETHLSRFKKMPVDITGIPEDSPMLLIVGHKRTETCYQFLFKFSYETNVLFFWDVASENIARKYFQSRIKVPLVNPQMPSMQLPPPNTRTIVSRDNDEMREYQVQGLKWLLDCWRGGHGSILADEMGLGKTIQVLSFLSYLNRNTGWHGPFLITVRTNCFKQWCDEIERWTDLRYIAYNSGPAQRAMMRDYMFPCLDELGNPFPQCISFNILLVSYDVFLKDIEYLGKYLWEVLVVDEGHRIKNSQGKKNNAMKNLKAKQRIILTGTPIQNSLTELWTLLKFVSPNYFNDNPSFLENDVDKLDQKTVLEARTRILPHLMRRSLAEAEHTLAPKEERVAFISLTQPQKDMLRLIKLHKLWRIKGVQTSEDDSDDSAHETNAKLKVCSHPFLIEGAEEYYSKKLNLPRLELILATSSKFQWLDKILLNLYSAGHKVLIFSQRVKLLKLLNEYCQLRNFPNQMLIGSMGETEKNAAIGQFSARDSNDFIFLISTRAGSEGLNLTVANTTIIFDPDWNPQNDLQAQGRCHRIGQTQKVDVLRLITYQTYEHEMFVRAQRKLGLWLTLLGSKPVDSVPESPNNEPPLLEPPPIPDFDPVLIPLDVLLLKISTVANDFSLPALDRLGAPLSRQVDYSDGTTDEAFIETFPVEVDDGSTRRTKRSRSRELSLDYQSAKLVFEQLKVYGYGQIEPITAFLVDHGVEQIERFVVNLIIFAFRAVPPQKLSYFPVLIQRVLTDYPEYNLKMLFCSSKNHWMDLFEKEHEMDIDIQPINSLRDDLFATSTEFLSIIEMKLIARYWLQLNKPFPFERLAPPISDIDKDLHAKITTNETFDPFMPRVMVIINQMRSDLILNQYDSCAYHFSWWSEPEFYAIDAAIRNFPFSAENPLAFHAKTGLLSKTTPEILAFSAQLRRMCCERRKGPLVIMKSLHKMTDAPSALSNSKGFAQWTTIQVRECEEMKNRIELLNNLKSRLETINDISEEAEFWSEYQEKKLFGLISEYGFDLMQSILLDERFGFMNFLSASDIQYLRGEKPRRTIGSSDVPDFVFNEMELAKYLSKNEARKPQDILGEEWRVEFCLPNVKKINFAVNAIPRKKKRVVNDDTGSFVLGSRYKPSGKRKKKTESSNSDGSSEDDFLIE